MELNKTERRFARLLSDVRSMSIKQLHSWCVRCRPQQGREKLPWSERASLSRGAASKLRDSATHLDRNAFYGRCCGMRSKGTFRMRRLASRRRGRAKKTRRCGAGRFRQGRTARRRISALIIATHRKSNSTKMSSGATTARQAETVTTVDGEALDLSKAQAMSRRNTYRSPILLPRPCRRE